MQLQSNEVWVNIYHRGWNASRFGTPKLDNPYTHDTDEHRSWLWGWEDGSEEEGRETAKAA